MRPFGGVNWLTVTMVEGVMDSIMVSELVSGIVANLQVPQTKKGLPPIGREARVEG
jgi:hypothetical protein